MAFIRIRAGKRSGRTVGAVAAVVAGVSVGAGTALGSSGGIEAPKPPSVDDVSCVRLCLGLREVAIGGKVEITGRNLDNVSRVAFRKEGGGRVGTDPLRTSATSVRATVPKGATTGTVKVRDGFGSVSEPTSRKLTVRAAGAVEDAGPFAVKEASARYRKTFYNAKRKGTLDYLFKADKKVNVRVDVIKRGSGKVVKSVVQRDRAPFRTHTVRWAGTQSGGKIAPNGAYRFRVRPLSGGSSSGARFNFYDHKFPFRGKHSYGDGIGAGRGHQGQDIFGACGTKIVAARGGTVQWRRYQSAAGYYVVIDGKRTKRDYVYMHMKRKGRPKQGTKVRTGQRIGFNSETGNASGCHLHFEMWSGPGWYEGGSHMDPTPHLKRWDSWS